MKETSSILYFGISDKSPQSGPKVKLGPDTVNFYPDDEGYLRNYPGRTDHFWRTDQISPPAYRGTAPLLNPITRVLYFKDAYQCDHLVFVQEGELREKYGNGYRTLYSFVGAKYGELYYPHLFLHEAKLVVVNFGDPVLVWDGKIAPHPLGVLEVPQPPQPRPQYAPGFVDAVEYGVFPWRNIWWTGEDPASGPSSNTNSDGDLIPGLYMVRLQYEDIYGNKSAPGATTAPIWVEPTKTTSGLGLSHDYDYSQYLTLDWTPPMSDEHIAGVWVTRTASLHPDDPQGGQAAYNLFYYERFYRGNTLSRHVCQASDITLLSNGPVDLTVLPPATAHMGCSWSSRVWLWGHEDDHIVTYSDISKFGQFRGTQSYRMNGPVRAGIPLSDRIVFVSSTSTEVLYESASGIAMVEQNFSMGSEHGRSFVDVGGAVFGLWNAGFGFYGVFDGQFGHRFVDCPYWIKKMYVDSRLSVTSAIKVGVWYRVSVSLYGTSDVENYILKFNLQTQEWYVLKERVYDMTDMNGIILGADDSIYELYSGEYPQSILHVVDLLPEATSPFGSRSFMEHRFLMEPSSSLPMESINVTCEWGELEAEYREGVLMPTDSSNRRDYSHRPYWNHPTFTYDDAPKWSAPGDFIMTPVMSNPVVGYSHRVRWVFPPGAELRLKALAITWSDEMRSDY